MMLEDIIGSSPVRTAKKESAKNGFLFLLSRNISTQIDNSLIMSLF